MILKKLQRQQLIQERARALAIVHLTRRDDLRVLPGDPDEGLELLVEIRLGPRGSYRRFGVAVSGSWEPILADQANKKLGPVLRKINKNVYGFPVCLFFFSMSGDDGYFTWIAEPEIHEGSGVNLRPMNRANCHALDRATLNTVVERVNRWYDALIAPQPSVA